MIEAFNSASRPGQRLVQQKNPWQSDQRSRQGHSLLFSARRFLQAFALRRFSTRNACRISAVRSTRCSAGKSRQTVSDVFFHSHVGKQCQRLKDISRRRCCGGSSRVSRNRTGRRRRFRLARIRLQQSGDAIEQCRFARAGGTKQDGDARRDYQSDIEQKQGALRGAPLRRERAATACAVLTSQATVTKLAVRCGDLLRTRHEAQRTRMTRRISARRFAAA